VTVEEFCSSDAYFSSTALVQGHGFKCQGHRNVFPQRHTDRRFVVDFCLVSDDECSENWHLYRL